MDGARAILLAIVQEALECADPSRLVQAALAAGEPIAAGRVLAVGKAAAKMLAGFEAIAGPAVEKLLIVPEGTDAPAEAVRGDHPIPTLRNVEAARRAREVIAGVDEDGLTVLLSGGASALLTLPTAPLSLEDLQHVTRSLLGSGADIRQMNCVRKHLEQLKGGRMAALAAPHPVRALVLSDVIGDDAATIGSGPVSPDPTTFSEARALVERFAPESMSVLNFLKEAEAFTHAETPKPGNAVFDSVRLAIIGNNESALRGAMAAAARLGFPAAHVERGITGEAAEAGRRLARLALRLHQEGKGPCSVIAGGETTVTVGTATGKGGRNQELALAAAIEFDGHEGVAMATLATDGVDGPTDAAGAVIDGRTCATARAANLMPTDYLQRHDSYNLFGRLEALIRTGPTGTNVNDLAVALIL